MATEREAGEGSEALPETRRPRPPAIKLNPKKVRRPWHPRKLPFVISLQALAEASKSIARSIRNAPLIAKQGSDPDPFRFAITKGRVSARVDNQLGRGQVVLQKMVEEGPNRVVLRDDKIAEVFNMHGRKIPANISVTVAMVQGHWSIIKLPSSYAVRIPGMSSVYFLTELPEVDDSFEVQEDAWVEIPTNVYDWPEGARRPEPILCQSSKDRRHYKLFKYPNEIEGTEWEDTGLNFGGTFSAESWRHFSENLPAIRALHAIPETESD